MTEELGGQPTDGAIRRRTLITAAAAAGVAAWTAPVIIDSLVSPAAALSFTGCRKINIPATIGIVCNPLPTSSSAWGTTCDSSFSSAVSSTCGSAISGVAVAVDTLANFGITRTVCDLLNTTLTLSATNCSWVDGEAHSTVSGCHAPGSIDNTTAGARTIKWPVGLLVDNYYVVITCT